ncbi:hypothetical protein BJ978_003234 [Agromyces terreus]|uniref:DUF4349 domain-containing protein n=1 Tax=Agromyces terreus TaxID=424795 RepID=A0A9X2H4U9_9MICO|nr:DUF4349 domain-containing protein [Agromyces terreus]MCP2372558.1 hypothetical protein [Agromyces terreus]
MRASQRSNRPGVERQQHPASEVGDHRHPLSRRRNVVVPLAGAALLVAMLAGCSAGGSAMSEQAPAAGGSADGSAPRPLSGEVALSDGAAPDAAEGADAEGTDVERSVVTTGDVYVTVDDPVEAAADAVLIAEQAGGRVDHRTENPGSEVEPAWASLTLRIPADHLDAVLDDLRELGDVTSVSMDASDVTQQHQDLDARITALKTSVGRMTALLAEAKDLGDLIAIESELTSRQGELDGLVQQREQLDDRIAYSTLSVGFATVDVAPAPAPDGFWGGLVAGWNGLLLFLGWLGLAVGVILPWVVAGLAVAAIVVAIVRLARRRDDRPPADPGDPGAAPGADGGAQEAPVAPAHDPATRA